MFVYACLHLASGLKLSELLLGSRQLQELEQDVNMHVHKVVNYYYLQAFNNP